MLEVNGLGVSYGSIRAVNDVSLKVARGEIVALIGANGAGKSSTLSSLMGLIPARAGRVMLNGTEITGWSTERVVRQGMTLTPEGRRVFAGLSVAENLALGGGSRLKRPVRQARLEHVYGLFPRLRERRDQQAGTLSGGEQQQLAIGRSLMSGPQMLLLDEPTLGLAPRLIDSIFDHIIALRREGTTILVVEQNLDRALEVADRGYVLANGRLRLSGTAAELAQSEDMTAAYLGMEPV